MTELIESNVDEIKRILNQDTVEVKELKDYIDLKKKFEKAEKAFKATKEREEKQAIKEEERAEKLAKKKADKEAGTDSSGVMCFGEGCLKLKNTQEGFEGQGAACVCPPTAACAAEALTINTPCECCPIFPLNYCPFPCSTMLVDPLSMLCNGAGTGGATLINAVCYPLKKVLTTPQCVVHLRKCPKIPCCKLQCPVAMVGQNCCCCHFSYYQPICCHPCVIAAPCCGWIDRNEDGDLEYKPRDEVMARAASMRSPGGASMEEDRT